MAKVELFCYNRNMNTDKGAEEMLDKYAELVHETNQQFNLTGAKTVEEIRNTHIAESLLVNKYLPEKFDSLVDIGSGAGFPALVIAINHPHTRVVLIESVGKKAGFLEKAILALGLTQARIVEGRVEEIAQDNVYREKFDVVTARFVAHLNVLVEYALPLLKVGGIAVFPKPPHETEIKEAEYALKIVGGEIVDIHHEKVSDSERDIIVIRKIEPTSKEFPRAVGLPEKKPL